MPSVKPIPVDLKEGKPRLLKMSADGMMLIEKELGCTIAELYKKPFSATVAMTMLWGALVWQDEALTLKDVTRLYDHYHDETGETFVELKPLLAKALSLALIKEEPSNGNGKHPSPNALTETGHDAPSPSGS